MRARCAPHPLAQWTCSASLCTPARRLHREHDTARCSTASGAAAVPSVRTMRDLHTTLLAFAHAAAMTPSATRGTAAPPHRVEAAPRSRSATTLDSSSRHGADDNAASAAAAAGAHSEQHLLHRLLLHRREERRQHEQHRIATREGAAQWRTSLPLVSSSPRRGPPPPSSSAALAGASWVRAFQLFGEAVQQHHVSPTAQHFNLLLYVAQQHAVWGRMDDVEELQARLLASVQELRREKLLGWQTSAATKQAQLRGSGGDRATAAAQSRQIDDLREMERALMPNAQTYELLLAGALARGAWDRALEYCEMRRRTGVEVLTDASVRQVLQVYHIAAAATAAPSTAAPVSAPLPSSSASASPAPQRLRTDERGRGLRAAAQPRLARVDSGGAPPSASVAPEEPAWSAGLRLFRGSLHRVSSARTVWWMATLLRRANQPAQLVQVVREDCQGLIQAGLLSVVAGASAPDERAALLQVLQLVSSTACELGDWRTALEVLHEVVDVGRQVRHARGAVVERVWGAAPSTEGTAFTGDTALVELTDAEDGDIMLDEVQLSQRVLAHALHTLRRVRRYTHIIDLYRSTFILGSATAAAATDDDDASLWRRLWTPLAMSYVAQAALATQDLPLLLHLCGLTLHGDDTGVTSPATPADAYDATLRLLQHRLLQQQQQHQQQRGMADAPPGSPLGSAAPQPQRGDAETLRWDTLSRRVYAAYRRRALGALAEEASPYRAYLARTATTSASDGGAGGGGGADGHGAPAGRVSDTAAALGKHDSPLLSPSHKPLVQLLAQVLGRDGSEPPPAVVRQRALQHLQQLRRPDTLAIALVVDVLRLQATAPSSPAAPPRRLPDDEAQSLLGALQQVLDTVVSAEHADLRIRLVPAPALRDPSATNAGADDESDRASAAASRPPRGQRLRRHLESASLTAAARGAVGATSRPTAAQLAAVSIFTAAAARMSFELLECVQPLALITYVAACVERAWLPAAAAPAQLQLAQRAVVRWADAELRRDTHRRTALPGAATREAEPLVVFAQLYAQCTPTSGTAAVGHAVLASAAEVLARLQRSAAGHAPTAAMSAFLSTLRHAWPASVAAAAAAAPPSPPSASVRHRSAAAMDTAVVVAVNAVVQQVGASAVGRWTMWGDCVDLLLSYLDPPSLLAARAATPPSTGNPPRRRAAATAETLRVLYAFLRACDKAEVGFVERVTLDWLLDSRATSVEAGRRCEERAGSGPTNMLAAVQHMHDRCTQAQARLQRQRRHAPFGAAAAAATAAAPEPIAPLDWESMLLVLGALTWACRRQAKPLVRRLYDAVAALLDAALRGEAVDAAVRATPLGVQVCRLRGAALATCMAVAQCLASGPRVEVLQDWPLLLRSLRQLTDHGATSALSSTIDTPHASVALVVGIAAVVVKVQRTWCSLVTELALDRHRAAGPTDEPRQGRRQSEPTGTAAARGTRVEDAAEVFAAWCTAELLPRLVEPCLRACVEHETRGGVGGPGATAHAAPPRGLAPPRTRAMAALHAVVDAVRDVDLAVFAWRVDVCSREGVNTAWGGEGELACALSRLRARGYRSMSVQLCWPSPADVATRLARHLHVWLLFAAHDAATPAAAVTALCRDLASLDTLHAMHSAVASASPLLSFFHFVAAEVDTVTEALTAAGLAGRDGAADANTPAERLTQPVVHYTPSVLRVVQQAAQWVLYLTLCEGTADAPPRLTDAVASTALPLLRRSLAWPGQQHTYLALLRAVEAAAHEALREPAAVVHVLRRMERLGHATESVRDVVDRSGGSSSKSSVEAFLTFYMHSPTLRRTSPVREDVCVAALLACAANAAWDSAATADEAADVPAPPAVLSELLTAFPHVVSDHLLTEWQQGRLPPRQCAVLTEWLLRVVWAGVQPHHGNSAGVIGAATPLRRASMQWLLATRGSILPSRALLAEEAAASAHFCAPETRPSAALLAAALDTASERCIALLGGAAAAAAAPLPLPPPRPPPVATSRSPRPTSSTATGTLAANVVQKLSTRRAALQLLQRYRDASNAARVPVRVRDEEAAALLRVLPEDARHGDAAAVLGAGAEPVTRPPPPPRTTVAAHRGGVAEWEEWLDRVGASLLSSSAELVPPPPPPPRIAGSQLRVVALAGVDEEQRHSPTWAALYTQLASVVKDTPPCGGDGVLPPSTADVPRDEHGSEHACYAAHHASTLRPAVLRLLTQVAAVPDGAAAEVGYCVCSLLLVCCVVLPLQRSSTPPSLVAVVAALRQEMWELLLSYRGGASQPHASGAHSAVMAARRSCTLARLCVRRLLLEALPQLPPPPHDSSVGSALRRAEATEALAALLLLVQCMSIDVAQLRAAPTPSAPPLADAEVAEDGATDVLHQLAREVLRLAGRELHELSASLAHSSETPPSCSGSPQDPAPLLRGRLARAWMQAGVLLGDPRSLLWVGQQLAAAAGERGVGRGGRGPSDTGEWLCVLPVAVAAAVVAGGTPARHSSAGLSDGLFSLAAAVPPPGAAAEAYVRVCRHWQVLLQAWAAQPADAQRRRSRGGPFAILLHGSAPADVPPALVEDVRRRLETYLAGPAAMHPAAPADEPATPSVSTTAVTASSSRGGAPLAAADVTAAFRCLMDADEGDVREFLRLEAARRGADADAGRRASPPRAVAIQAAWRLIHAAAIRERQRCSAQSSTSGATAACPPLVPLSMWRAYMMGLPAVVPQTVHFIPAAVTEMVVLCGCATWVEACAVLQHSLRTLQRSGPTPVQQYTAQLLLERVRRGEERGAEPFSAGLAAHVYTVPAPPPLSDAAATAAAAGVAERLWWHHMAQRPTHGVAALVCRVVDLLLTGHHRRGGPPSPHATDADTDAGRPREAGVSHLVTKHTLVEALRCGVHDAALTCALFRLFWAAQYRRVEGAHVFLSALRAAKLTRCVALALEAMLTYLRVADAGETTARPPSDWMTRVLRDIDAAAALVVHPSPDTDAAWQHLRAAAATAAGLQGPSHRFTVEAHRATWKSWTVLCRQQIIPHGVALCVVRLFQREGRLTEVEELMVTTCYAAPAAPTTPSPLSNAGGGRERP